MDARARRRGSLALGAVLVAQSLGCGTILYPERRGQRGGRIDAGVAVLDGVGLIFFILPGVVAFAVDFGDGAIYLPAGHGRNEIRRVPFDPKDGGAAAAEAVVRAETGCAVRLDAEELRSVAARPAELPRLFAGAPEREGSCGPE